jgi:hypothetical protein
MRGKIKCMDNNYPLLSEALRQLNCTSWTIKDQGTKGQSHLLLEAHFGDMVINLPIAGSLLFTVQGQQFIITGLVEELKQRGLYSTSSHSLMGK